MAKGRKFLPSMLWITAVILFVILIMQPLFILHFREDIAMLFPAGKIALEQRNLLFIIQIVMLFVIIPVYVLTFIFSWVYRASNPRKNYDPDLIDNRLAEYIWWGIPLVLTAYISVLTYIKTHELDPFKPLQSDKKPMTVEVVALQWKWLFIYPEEKVASLNFLQIPRDVPITFKITADAPMNSFWIPHLGGQIYAMPGMQSELNLIANSEGDFRGSSANLSGEGFSAMHFITRASSEEEYKKWIETAKQSTKSLSLEEYKQLAAPSKDNPAATYVLKDENLFDQIIKKYMQPQVK